MRHLAAVTCLALVHTSCTEPELAKTSATPETTASAPTAAPSASAPGPGASASAAPKVEPPVVAYAPLPRVEACTACPWKGTGCVAGSDKDCALDPTAWWELRVVRARTSAPSSDQELVCVTGSTESIACGIVTKKKENGLYVLAPDKPENAAAIVSSADLVGLNALGVQSSGRTVTGAIAPKLMVDAALFDKGTTVSGADGDQIFVTLKPAAPPKNTGRVFATLLPQPSPHTTKDPESFRKANDLAKIAMGIDAKLASYTREVALTHRKSGFEIRLIGFYEGKKLVKALAQLPYMPPLLDVSYYFQDERLIVSRSVAYGSEENVDITTSFFDDKSEIWSDHPEFDPSKKTPYKAAAIAAEIKKALKDPSYHLTEETL